MTRQPSYPIDAIFLNRWSPRAMSGEPLSDEELFSLFEAARWAPSSMNEQPWKFLYAKRETPHWNMFFDLLFDGNKTWCSKAAVLVVMISKKKFSKRDAVNVSASFSTGSAFENLALQASLKNIVVHGMGGFDYEKARVVLEIPDDYVIDAMCAIGKHGNVEDLDEQLRAREFPSERKPLKEIVIEGKFRE